MGVWAEPFTTLRLDVPVWRGHRAGQHVDVRLTAEDGYQAQRTYSIASPPEEARLALTVEVFARWAHGVLADAVRAGGGEDLTVRVWESPIAFGAYGAPVT